MELRKLEQNWRDIPGNLGAGQALTVNNRSTWASERTPGNLEARRSPSGNHRATQETIGIPGNLDADKLAVGLGR